MRWLAALSTAVLALAACGGGGGNEATPAASGDSPGARMEAAAVAQGLVADPASATLFGAWARDTDRACVVDTEGGQRIGIVSDYGEGQGCSGAGSVDRQAERLRVTIGRCRFVARFDGEQIAFPGDMPAACDTLCRGRASLAGFAVERQSESASEAATLRGRGGRKLCG